MVLFRLASTRMLLLCVLIFLISTELHAQRRVRGREREQEQEQVVTFTPISYKDTVIFNSISLPLVYDTKYKNLKQSLIPECSLTKPLFPPLRISEHKLFADVHNKNAIDAQAYDYLKRNNIRNFRFTAAVIPEKIEQIEVMSTNIFDLLFKIDYEPSIKNVPKPARYVPKQKYWTYSGKHTIQLSQNYITENWSKGGTKELKFFHHQIFNFNFKKNKFSANNVAEWNLSLSDNPKDTVRNYKIGNDLLRVSGNFGLTAIKNWSYSSNIEIRTQALKKFTVNSDNIISSIASPLYVKIGILGMKYTLAKTYPKVKGKTLNLTVDVSPFAINYVTVLDKARKPAQWGIKEGKWHKTTYGYLITSELKVKFNQKVDLHSKFRYYSTFENTEAESENRLSMPINRFFKVNFNAWVVYNDNKKLKKDPKFGYFQLNELLSFGFDYSW